MKNSSLAKKIARSVKWHANARNYELVELEEYAAKAGLEVEIIIPESTIRSKPPKFFGGNKEIDFSIYDGTSVTSDVKMMKVPYAVAVGRSEFIIKDGCAFYPRPFDPKLYTFMLEIEGRAKVDLRRSCIKVASRSRTLKVGSVISLLGQCNTNYAHWLLEVLTRLALVETIPTLKGFALLVDDPGVETLRSALHVLNVFRRDLIFVRNAQKVEAQAIIFLTSPSFTPPETRRFFNTSEIDEPRGNQFRFSPAALQNLREFWDREVADFYLPRTSNQTVGAEFSAGSRLVYLQRKPGTSWNGRQIHNSRHVETLLAAQDFSIVDTAIMDFAEQILALKNAKVVVSAAGAALVNLVFCEPGVRVVLLSPQYRDANWFYWTNLMAAMGHHLYIVLGPQVSGGSGQLYHRDFRVSLSLLDLAVSEALRDAGFSGCAEEKDVKSETSLRRRASEDHGVSQSFPDI